MRMDPVAVELRQGRRRTIQAFLKADLAKAQREEAIIRKMEALEASRDPVYYECSCGIRSGCTPDGMCRVCEEPLIAVHEVR